MNRIQLKFLFAFLLISCAGGQAFAQLTFRDSTRLSPNPVSLDQLDREFRAQLNPHLRVYRNAKDAGDWATALVALNYVLLNDSNAMLKDTLVALYLRTGNPHSAEYYARRFLKANPEDAFLLAALHQICYNKADYACALESAQKLVNARKGDYYLYQQASCEFLLGRYGECRRSLDRLKEDQSKETILLSSGDQNQEVPILAAAWNLSGNVSLALNNPEQAKSEFAEALKLMPDFVLAQNNLNALNTEGKKKKKP